MLRSVNAHLELDVAEPAELILSIAAAARDAAYESVSADLSITADGEPVSPQEIEDVHGGLLHVLRPRTAARLVVDYTAQVAGRAAPPPVDELDVIGYRRPSRYVESDELLATAAEFRGRDELELLDTVTDWVHRRLAYVSGSSRSTDGAVRTFLSRRGVCRDFAHLTIALLRACDVPARLVSVYAPGLSPMDFHAVTEAYVGGRWHVVDPTRLAPRDSMVRICTGRDAADTAFLTTYEGVVTLRSIRVGAVVDPELPVDDPAEPQQLG